MKHIKVCVTGGTGFVGREVIRQLLEHGCVVHVLVRNESSAKKLKEIKEQYPSHLKFFFGSATKPLDIEQPLDGCSALVHLVGTRRKEIKETGLGYIEIDLGSAMAAAEAMTVKKIKRILFLSAGAIGDSEYVRTKLKAEYAIRDAGLDWTIFRPAFIIGPGQQWPFLMGPFLWLLGLMPANVGITARKAGNLSREELAKAFIRALESDEMIGKILEVPDIKHLR